MADRRAQSNPLATVILLGIVLTTASTVVLFGGGVIDTLSTTADTERATQEMTQLASESAAVALGGSQQRRVTFDASEGKLTVNETASWICVQNGTTSNREFILPEDGVSGEDCAENKTFMGTAVYDTGAGRVAYEGGGVWTKGDDGESRMVSPPEFHYRGETLTLPVVVLDGNVSRAGSETELTVADGTTEQVDGISNPLENSSGRVYVTVHSRYYEAWGDFIAERTDGRVVELDDDNRTVTVELVVPSPPEIQHAIYASSDEDQAVTVDSGLVDSYDSGESPPRYDPPNNNGSAGSIATDGGVEVEDTVRGNVYTVRQGGLVEVDEGAVDGEIHSQQSVSLDSTNVTGSVYADGNVTVDDGVNVGGEVHTDSGLEMDSGNLSGDVYANGGIDVDGDVVSGEVHTDDTATIDGGTFESSVYVGGGLNADEAAFEDEVHVEGDLESDEATYDDSIYVDGDVTKLAGDDSDPTDVEGDVNGTGDATLEEVTITGDLTVEGDVTCDSSTDIQGEFNAYSANLSSDCPTTDGLPSATLPDSADAPADTEAPDEPVIDPPAVDLPDDGEYDSLPDDCRESGNPNNDGIVIDTRTCSLPPGKYNVSKLDIDGDDPSVINLDVDTESGGTVELYVGGEVSIEEDARIKTGDSGHYNASELEINVYDDDASVDVSRNVTGVINAPDTKVDLDSGAHVHGAVVADEVQADGDGGVHSDEALSGSPAGDGSGDSVTVRYLHVTTNEVELEDD